MNVGTTSLIIWLVSAGFFLTLSAIVVVRRFQDRENAPDGVKKIILALMASWGLFGGGLELAVFLSNGHVGDLVLGLLGIALFVGASMTFLRKTSAKKGV